MESIHRTPFLRCCEALERVASRQESWSVLFFGQAGCGKTHLLARFHRWIQRGLDGGDGAPRAFFVAVRMETSPSQVWRHLRRRLAERLLQRLPDGSFPLDVIVRRFAAPPGTGLAGALEQANIPDLTLDLARVLSHYESGRLRMTAKAWLRGEPLRESDLEALGVAAGGLEDAGDEQGEDAARQFVLAITRLAAPWPVAYCFDQLEALQLGPAGHLGFGPFAKMCATLVDDTPNSLVVSSILTEFRGDLERGALASDFARLSKERVDLHPLSWEEGRALIAARLDTVQELAPWRGGGVAPLPERALKELFERERSRVPARKLIHHARGLFETAQGRRPEPSRPVAEFLAAVLERFWSESAVRRLPEETDTALAHGLPILAAVADIPVQESCRPGADLCLGPPAAPKLVALANQPHMTALAALLRRLSSALSDEEKSRLVLLRDPRLPIRPGARKTRMYLEELERAGARLVRPQEDATAAVDAIRRMLTQAQSGDLANDGETIGPGTVREWLAANVPDSARDLLGELTGAAAAADGADTLLDLLRERLLLTADDAAALCGLPAARIENHARANPDRIGYLAGTPAVVFHVVPAPIGDGDDPA